MHRWRLVLTVFTCLSLSATGARHSDVRAEKAFDAARGHYDAGKLEEARQELDKGLAFSPYDRGGYQLASDLANAQGSAEGQIQWGKWLYWSHVAAGESREAQAVATILDGIYDGWNRDHSIIEGWHASVSKTAKSAVKSKHGRVSSFLYRKLLELNPADTRTLKLYEKVTKKFGGGTLGQSYAPGTGHSQDWIERQNRIHADWKNAFETKTKHFEIITNTSFEMFDTLEASMEHAYDYYAEVLGYRGKPQPLKIAVHRDEDEFKEYCSKRLGIRVSGPGIFYVPHESALVACDWTGGDYPFVMLDSLYELASRHVILQMTKKSGQAPPAWIYQGASAYFGGCEPRSDGTLTRNRPDPYYLASWKQLEDENFDRSLEEVITCSSDSYDRTFSPYGWSLVYFLNNYEDAQGYLTYRDAFLAYVASFKKKGPKEERERNREAFERAQKFFVQKVDDSEVGDWAAFEERWRAFIQRLTAESSAGDQMVAKLQKRSQDYMDRGNWLRAEVAIEMADEKRPSDPETHRLLALVNRGLEHEDLALMWMLSHWESCLSLEADDKRQAAEAWMSENGGGYLVEGYCAVTNDTISAIEGAMDAAISDGFPGTSMLFASHAMQAFGFDVKTLLYLVEDVRRDLASVDLRLWRKAFVKGSGSNRTWSGTDVVTYDSDGVLVNNPVEFGRPQVYCDRPELRYLVPPYEIRGTLVVDGVNGAYLDLGAPWGKTRRAALCIRPTGSITAYTIGRSFDDEGQASVSYEVASNWKTTASDRYEFALTIREEGGGELKLGDKVFELPKRWSAEQLTGRFGVAAGDGAVALFQEILVRPGQPFWPVNPAALQR